MDWRAWHNDYDEPGSELSRRLAVVKHQVRVVLDRSPTGELSAISLCAGQGRDLLDVLADHPRRADVHARLVELDQELCAAATERARGFGLDQVDVVTADAARTDQYDGMVPADLVLACGIFGNIADEDIQRTIAAFPQFCRTGATLIWTRHRDDPDLVPQICEWFESHEFERAFVTEPEAGFGVGVHRYVGDPQPLVRGQSLFSFVLGGV